MRAGRRGPSAKGLNTSAGARVGRDSAHVWGMVMDEERGVVKMRDEGLPPGVTEGEWDEGTTPELCRLANLAGTPSWECRAHGPRNV